mmetsp:Transcript_1787/g.3835  ORF Transcript_1787/g.3835 Transcript_1787/m.3835 type:complete len:2049 (+) Transcript_1787:263-6409(+)|eukprot:CAMPEP_0172297576 /NCGR_PEP_ID=MMETSP1058-20130122/540_1 /TAXON_ID=83371 /ORGANISM="Detonula confervacea, Strain CCMP 353" /LENGTH=2048 /DNA_ID=CAMNT_0013006741 /DNA_START=185 /DNA_END=6331 /DNA_ORIENTATION=-
MSTPSNSWSWRHRFYAFLLRRALGPFLTPQSTADLHRSIQAIDWSTGKFALVDVELDPAYLTSAIQGKKNADVRDDNNISEGSGKDKQTSAANNITVHQARIRRFAIHLSYQNKTDDASSSARKATSAFLQSMFGTNDTADDGGSATGMALVVHVELEGLDIVLAPGQHSEADLDTEWSSQSHQHNQPLTPNPGQEPDASAPGFFTSLVDSAMKSLRLSIDVSDVKIRAYSQYCNSTGLSDNAMVGDHFVGGAANTSWVTLHIASARYYDLIESKDGETHASGVPSDNRRLDWGRGRPNNNNATMEKICKTGEKIVISKALDWEGIVVHTGERQAGRIASNTSESSLPIFQSSGDGKMRFRVFEKWSKSTSKQMSSFLSARQDIAVSLGERTSVEVDLCSMTRVIEIANAMTRLPEEDDFVDACEDNSHRTWEDASDVLDRSPEKESVNEPQKHALEDEFSRETYDQIMKQFTEARHLARTRELRGGLLIPSFDERDDSNGNDRGEISFDAFFDANDHSVSYYCSRVDDNVQRGEEEFKSKGEKSHRSMEQTKIELGFAEFTVKVHIGSSTMEGMDHTAQMTSMEQENQSEFILLSLGDLQVIAFRSNAESKFNCSLSHFDIESQVINGDNTIINEPILRFLDGADGGFGSELLVSSPPCVSLMAELSIADDQVQNNSCRLDIALQPLEVIYQEQALQYLSNVVAKLHQSESPASEEDQNIPSMDLHLSACCSSILLLVPCQHDSKQMPREAKPNPLFRRHGYIDQGSGGSKFLGIGLELDSIAIDLSRTISIDDSSEESKAVMTCSHAILFAKGTELERGRRNRKFASFVSRRADLLTIAGDEDSESSVLISFSSQSQQSTKRKSAFPIILPLSSTKARQEMDESDDEVGNLYGDAFKCTSRSSRIQTSDPQYILSSEANEAERELVINIPNIFFDSTTSERQELSNLLSRLCSDGDDSEYSNSKSQASPTKAHVHDNNLLGLAVNVGQMSVVLHGSQPNTSNSYSLVMDEIKIHTLIGRSGVRNVRFLSHDVTLYELSTSSPVPNVYCTRNQYPTSCIERCKRIRERLNKSPSTLARAIFFRQKLSQPLSPETPAFLIDVLHRGDDECGEMSLHISIYDMTHRYIMNSEWIQNLTVLIKGESNEKESEQVDNNLESQASLINLFVNLSDCNMDYTPPLTFRNPSRVILRMGEIRFSSNIVTPSATAQAYKVSLTDLTLQICNYRHSYNEENSLLSLSRRHLNKEDTFVPDRANCLLGRHIVGLDDALCRMDFVNVVVLDTADAIIFKSKNVRSGNRQNDPAVTVALTLGKLSINACHDSFSCLSQTYNEWFIKATALSEEELENLRDLSETQSEVDLGKEISSAEDECLLPVEHQPPSALHLKSAVTTVSKAAPTPGVTHVSNKASSTLSKQHQYRDDTVSLDLTKSLLFQNYYTFDATTNRQAIDQRQEVKELAVKKNGDMPLQSSPSDDEWATVEHDFLQHSNIPRERDQTAEWVVCDSRANAGPACDATSVSNQSETFVQVFPQHIPLKPVLDPFAGGGPVDTAKLAGTDDAPDIGMRVIVKGSMTFRFFDGFDWVNNAPQFHQRKEKPNDRKKELLSSLMGGDKTSSALDVIPLPEERNKNLQRDLARRKLRRNVHRYFQISIGGLKLRNDSFAESKEHLLASCLDLSVSDFFVAETISNGEPLKMMGEWIDESVHPRDGSDGIIMLTMNTKHPRLRVSSDGKLMSDESRATLELLPLRCYFNQNALRFIRSFFAGVPSKSEGEDENDIISDDEIINIFFETFKVRPCKLKVDYQPENCDINSFRDGNYIEILNLCPLEEMILTFQPVEMESLTGWGSVFSEVAGRWIEDVCATQAHKFLTRASPFQPFSNLGDPLADLAMVLVVPEGNITDYFKNIVGGTTHFAGKVAFEALSTSAKITRFAANQLSSKALRSSGVRSSLPRRPRNVPRHAGDAAGHAYESVAGGLREANYKIVTIPLREYQNKGAGGAACSALRGIPIGVIAPIAGASEALSYTLLGLRNQLRPDMRKEEEESLRGLNYD